MTKEALLNPTQDAALAKELISVVDRHIKSMENAVIATELDHDTYRKTIGALAKMRNLRADMQNLYTKRVSE